MLIKILGAISIFMVFASFAWHVSHPVGDKDGTAETRGK